MYGNGAKGIGTKVSTIDGENRRDRALIKRAKDGDKAAFEQLYTHYERRIYNFCLRTCGNAQDAADATHEAFLIMLQRLGSLDPEKASFGGYILKVARTTSLRAIKRRARSVPQEEPPEPTDRELELEDDPERSTLLTDQQTLVRSANVKLAPRQRQALVLRELEGMSYAQVADVLGMSENATAQLISRARLRLRSEIRGAAAGAPLSSGECEKALPLLSKSVDGELAADESAWMQQHVHSCKSCKTNRQAIEEAGLLYRSWPPAGPAAALAEKVLSEKTMMALMSSGSKKSLFFSKGVSGTFRKYALLRANSGLVALTVGAGVLGISVTGAVGVSKALDSKLERSAPISKGVQAPVDTLEPPQIGRRLDPLEDPGPLRADDGPPRASDRESAKLAEAVAPAPFQEDKSTAKATLKKKPSVSDSDRRRRSASASGNDGDDRRSGRRDSDSRTASRESTSEREDSSCRENCATDDQRSSGAARGEEESSDSRTDDGSAGTDTGAGAGSGSGESSGGDSGSGSGERR